MVEIEIYKESEIRAKNPHKIEIEDKSNLSYSELRDKIRELGLKRYQWERFDPHKVFLTLKNKIEGHQRGFIYKIKKLLFFWDGKIIAETGD